MHTHVNSCAVYELMHPVLQVCTLFLIGKPFCECLESNFVEKALLQLQWVTEGDSDTSWPNLGIYVILYKMTFPEKYFLPINIFGLLGLFE